MLRHAMLEPLVVSRHSVSLVSGRCLYSVDSQVPFSQGLFVMLGYIDLLVMRLMVVMRMWC